MTETAYPGDLRVCPFCKEPIRKKAIKCKHCGGEINSKKVRQYGRQGEAPWHYAVLGVLFLLVVFLAIAPRLSDYWERRHTVDHPMAHLFHADEAKSTPSPKVAPEKPVRPRRERILFGEDVELAVGKSYFGDALADLLEQYSDDGARFDSTGITFDFLGERFLVSIEPSLPGRHLDVETRYEIVLIEKL
jgi:hypothetical protein